MRDLKIGDKIRMLGMQNDPDPIPVGTIGTVTGITKISAVETQVSVNWENGRTLMVLIPFDNFEIVAA